MLTLTSATAAEALPGQVYAFGDNKFGQLGNTTVSTTESPNPTPGLLTLPGATGPVVQVAAGRDHSLLLTATGQVFGAGSNSSGQLGVASNSGTPNANVTPALIGFPGATGPIVQVAAGDEHSLALTSTGQLYGFGNNTLGELGTAASSTPSPVPALAALPGATGTIRQIAAGAVQSFAVTSTGQLFAFGRNRYGELARATNEMEQANLPEEVILPGATGPVAQVAAGANHTLALTATGQLYAFGENYFGQLGSTTNNEIVKANSTPALVSLPGATGAVVQVSAGLKHSLALTSSGQLYSFGINREGQLGIPTNSGESLPNPAPAQASLPGASGGIVQLSAGQDHSLVVTSSGQLFAFGSNRFGQLGNPTNAGTAASNPTPALISFPFGTTIDAVARGSDASHTLALVADLAVLSAALPPGQVGVPYHASAVAGGGTGAYSWSATGLPAGLAIDASGQIAGTPVSAGASAVVLRVSDLFGVTAPSATIPLTIAPAVSGKPTPGGVAFTVAQLKANLLSQLKLNGKAARISALLKHKGYSYSFTAWTAGSLSINWYFLAPGARLSRKAKAKPLLLASGQVSFKAPGKKKIAIRLSGKGVSFLRHKQSVKISLKGTFTPAGQKAITATRALKLKR